MYPQAIIASGMSHPPLLICSSYGTLPVASRPEGIHRQAHPSAACAGSDSFTIPPPRIHALGRTGRPIQSPAALSIAYSVDPSGSVTALTGQEPGSAGTL